MKYVQLNSKWAVWTANYVPTIIIIALSIFAAQWVYVWTDYNNLLAIPISVVIGMLLTYKAGSFIQTLVLHVVGTKVEAPHDKSSK